MITLIDVIDSAIEESKYILDLKNNDEEDANCSKIDSNIINITWKKATNFLILYSKLIFELFQHKIDSINIYDGNNNSIDILCRSKRYRLLINIPSDDIKPILFYGDDLNSQSIKGEINFSLNSNLINLKNIELKGFEKL